MGMEHSRERINQRKRLLKQQILEKIGLLKQIDDEQVYTILDEVITEAGREQYLSLRDKQTIKKELFNSLRRLDILQEDRSIFLLKKRVICIHGITALNQKSV